DQAFRKAIELDPTSGAAHLAIATFYWGAGRWAEAEQALKTAVNREPENPLAHRVIADFYLATNRAPQAEPHLKKVLDLTGALSARLALAEYYVARNDEAAART